MDGISSFESPVSIGLTMGDPAGIGVEIIVKALPLRELGDGAKLVVIGNRKVLTDALNIVGSEQILTEITDPSAAKDYGYINYIECGLPREPVAYGQVSREAGQAAYAYVTKAIQLALDGCIAAVVTAPLNKEA